MFLLQIHASGDNSIFAFFSSFLVFFIVFYDKTDKNNLFNSFKIVYFV